MKKLVFLFIIFASCNNKAIDHVDSDHIGQLARDFMESKVIPHMKEPKPYEVLDTRVVIKKAADIINDYTFTYNNLSFNREDSIQNKKHLDSVIQAFPDTSAVISVTVNVAYNTRYKRGNVVTDSIKLAYDPKNDKVSYWPF